MTGGVPANTVGRMSMPRNPFTIDRIEVYPLRARAGRMPEMSLAAMPDRPGLLVRLDARDGAYGWGEIWCNFPPRANRHKADLVEDVIAPVLTGRTFRSPDAVQAFCRARLSRYALHVGQRGAFEHCFAGIDIAAWDLALRASGLTAAACFGLAEAVAAPYASSVNADGFETTAGAALERGLRSFKLKVGAAPDRDAAFVRRARAFLPAGAGLMIDANQAWSLDRATAFLREVRDVGLAFAEEPLPADAPFDDWRRLAAASDTALAVGENVYGVAAFAGFVDDAGVRYLQPDVAKWGGLSGALALLKTPAAGRAAVWPHYMGAGVGQSAALVLSAVAGDGSRCELDVNPNPLRTDLTDCAFAPVNGRLPLSDRPGLVHEPRADALARFRE